MTPRKDKEEHGTIKYLGDHHQVPWRPPSNSMVTPSSIMETP
jgi:hypothetical protein